MSEDWNPDKAAHVLYGMDPKSYDQGMRYAWSRMNVCQVHKPGSAQPTYRFEVPIIHEDGTPWVVKSDRPNTVGILTGIKDVQA
jgi:hypothetical protein